MIFRHPAHERRELRLGYCLNLAPADDVPALLALLERLALPLAERFASGGSFGVGLYLSNALARALDPVEHPDAVERVARFLAARRLDPFTCNAFPIGGFGEAGLKAGVFKPGWHEPARLAHTVAVASAMAAITAQLRSAPEEGTHVSISTHTGGLAADLATPKAREQAAANLARAADELARIEERTGVRVILALEPEPGANAPDHAALRAQLDWTNPRAVTLLEEERNRESAHAAGLFERHVGACLDTCHAAVAGETDALHADLAAGTARGPAKLQLSNALKVRAPDASPAAVAALFALDEPRFLHQVRAHGRNVPEGVDDLPALRAALETNEGARWRAAEAWTCHFHVPLDLEHAQGGIETTRGDAARLLTALAADPARWSTRELHVEIETYTWDALPGWARGEGELVEGMAREVAWTIEQLGASGWRRAAARAPRP